jgi:hypothetical protein
MIYMLRRILSLAAALVIPFALGGAGDAALDRSTLRGLTALGVVVDRVDAALVQEGLTRDAFQARLERGLQTAGIKIDPNAKEFLALRVLQVRANRGPFGICLSVGLYQPVLLARDQTMRTATQTWEAETVLLAEPKLVNEAAISSLDDLADRFVAAWRSVNPR